MTRQRGFSLDASTRSSPSGTSMSISSNSKFEGGLHVGGADEARCSVVLASLLPQSFAFGEGHLDPAVAAGNGAFDRDFSGHFPNITTTAQGRGFGAGAQSVQSQLYLRRLHAGEA